MTTHQPLEVFATPPGGLTNESRVLYAAGTEATPPIELKFYQRARIVGFYFVITGATFDAFTDGAGAAPTLDELDVRINLVRNGKRDVNNRQDSPTSQVPEGFTVATALDVRNFRRFDIDLDDPDATIAVAFRGRYATAGSNGFGMPVLCSVVAVWQPLAPGASA